MYCKNSENGSCIFMKQESSFRIFFTDRVPFDTAGKAIPSVWKMAESYGEMLDLISLKVSPVKSAWKMLYDRENLYIHVQCRCPGAFTSPEEKQEWAKPHLSFFFSLGEGDPGQRTLRLSVNENGAVNTVILNGYSSQGGSARETVLPDLKCFVRIRELQKSYVWETGIILPFAALERPMPLHGETVSFSAFHCKKDPRWECILEFGILSYVDTVYSDGTQWIRAAFAEKECGSSPRCFSATDQLLARYKKAQLQLSPEMCREESYKNILGMNNSPRIKMSRIASNVEKEQALFRQLGPARVRHHDAALCDPGFALIDVSRIFPLFRADHNDPENYDFAPTDLCLRYVAECGVPIEFRFGESIEHSERKFRVKPPADPEKWAQICVNIMRHYKEGWHNGMKLEIPYASVWEEPDGILLDGPYEKYLEMYEHFARAMAKAFPEVRIGGPQSLSIKSIEELLSSCREKDLAIDFISKTAYFRNPAELAYAGKTMRSLAGKYSYKNLEVFLAEWHYAPRSWKRFDPEDCVTMENAAFSLAGMICMQEVVDMAYYYLWASPGYYGLFNNVSEPYKVYYALCLYTEFIRKNGKKLPLQLDLPGCYSLASVAENGNVFLLCARFRSLTETLEVTLPGMYKVCRMKIVSDSSPRGEIRKTIRSNGEGKFSVPFEEGMFGAYLLEFEK